MIKTEFMDLYEELSFLNEAEDPYLRAAMQMFQTDEDAKGVVVSCKPEGQAVIKVCRLYHSDEELRRITKALCDKYDDPYINAYHSRDVIEFYNDKWKKADTQEQKEAQTIIDNLFEKKLKDTMKAEGIPYLDVLDYITEEEWLALYKEYLPNTPPADGEEQDRLIKLFVKALKQKVNNKNDNKELEQATLEEPQKAEPKNAKLNRARQNNLKIIKAFKEVGLPADDLTVTAKNKKGKDYRKASDKLNKLRKTLFGEALDDENVFNQDF
jgi:hypothetical protein